MNTKIFTAISLAVAVIAVAGYALLAKDSPFHALPKGSVTMSANEVQTLINKVGTHIVIKTDEKPTVATIQDAAILRAQNPDFYRDAVAGDKLLIWSDKAVLYSVSYDRLLSVLPIRLPAPVGVNAAQAATTQAEKAVIEVRNGTKTLGLGKTVADRLKAAGLNASIVDTAVKNYATTLIMVAPGKPLTDTAKKLQGLIGGSLSAMPAGEAAMKGDILVIIGANYKK